MELGEKSELEVERLGLRGGRGGVGVKVTLEVRWGGAEIWCGFARVIFC